MEKFGKETYIHGEFSYYEDKTTKNETWRCSTRKNTKCPAFITKVNGVLKLNNKHRDLPRRHLLQKKRLEAQIVKKAVNSTEKLKDIFKQAEQE